MTTETKPDIPLHTKWGFRITAIIILLIAGMVVKNCLGSFRYGISTEQAQQKQYYDLGYAHGVQRARGMPKVAEPKTDNLLLRKLYRKGYRDGWDSVQPGAAKTDSDGPAPPDR